VVDAVNYQPLAGILVTAVDREGLLRGPDLPLMARVAAVLRAPDYASGGITTLDDLRALADHGLAGAIVGMALYTGALEPRAAAEEFGK
jgi:phosphoribosylformimino-5-aminoimidazole carboxamide ribotide isomerase